MSILQASILALCFGLAALIGYAYLVKRTPIDREEDGAQSEHDAQEIVEASRPAPLTWDNAYAKRPHIRAGEKQ